MFVYCGVKYQTVKNRFKFVVNSIDFYRCLLLSLFFVILAGCLLIVPVTFADERTVDANYVLSMDLDDLMKAEVTSVSRYGKLQLDAPAAITVIDSEQIQNSGLREIPELLRLVPGLQVTRYSASGWDISSRELPEFGFYKLLVLIDGRTIYSEDVGFTLWEAQSLTLEDIERIEVIRGPGGTLWGYNSVNGVVNIITKSTEQTQGTLVDSGIADDGSHFVQLRHGLKLNDQTHMRVYYHNTGVESFETESGISANDGFDRQNGGFRLDYTPSETSQFAFDGRTSKNTNDFMIYGIDAQYEIVQSHIRSKWLQQFSPDLSFALQVYYDLDDYTDGITSAGQSFAVEVQNLDIETQADWRIHRSHRLVIGGGYRHSFFDLDSGFNPEISSGILFENSSVDWQSFNLFFNDEITLLPDRVWFTVGTKLEYNEKTSWGWQPNARLLYKPKPNQSLWASISRSLKRPAFADTERRIDLYGGPFEDFIRGEPSDDEKITAYELGYRNQITPDFSFDIAAYYNDHDQILLSDWQQISPFSFELFNNYDTSAIAYGGELSINWQLSEKINVMGSYSYFYTDYDMPEIFYFESPVDKIDRHFFQLHLNYSPISSVNIALNTYYTAETTYDTTILPENLRLDLLLGWQVTPYLQLNLVGQNLADSSSVELDYRDSELFGPFDPTEIPRTFYLSLKAAF